MKQAAAKAKQAIGKTGAAFNNPTFNTLKGSLGANYWCKCPPDSSAQYSFQTDSDFAGLPKGYYFNSKKFGGDGKSCVEFRYNNVIAIAVTAGAGGTYTPFNSMARCMSTCVSGKRANIGGDVNGGTVKVYVNKTKADADLEDQNLAKVEPLDCSKEPVSFDPNVECHVPLWQFVVAAFGVLLLAFGCKQHRKPKQMDLSKAKEKYGDSDGVQVIVVKKGKKGKK